MVLYYKQDAVNLSKNWEAIKNDFSLHFGGSDIIRSIKKSIIHIKQRPNETVLNYYYDLLDLTSHVKPPISTSDRRDYFENGLLPSYRYTFKVLCPCDDSLTEDKLIGYVPHLYK